MRYGKLERCPNVGYVPYPEGKFRAWKFGRCNKCGVFVLPRVTRYVDPSWLRYDIPRKWENWLYERRHP